MSFEGEFWKPNDLRQSGPIKAGNGEVRPCPCSIRVLK